MDSGIGIRGLEQQAGGARGDHQGGQQLGERACTGPVWPRPPGGEQGRGRRDQVEACRDGVQRQQLEEIPAGPRHGARRR